MFNSRSAPLTMLATCMVWGFKETLQSFFYDFMLLRTLPIA